MCIFPAVPLMQFAKESYIVDEREKVLHVPIVRSGDLSYESSVICYTRQQTAWVMEDYRERIQTSDSRIYFKPGDKVRQFDTSLQLDSSSSKQWWL